MNTTERHEGRSRFRHPQVDAEPGRDLRQIRTGRIDYQHVDRIGDLNVSHIPADS
jgi:hypothetical protein